MRAGACWLLCRAICGWGTGVGAKLGRIRASQAGECSTRCLCCDFCLLQCCGLSPPLEPHMPLAALPPLQASRRRWRTRGVACRPSITPACLRSSGSWARCALRGAPAAWPPPLRRATARRLWPRRPAVQQQWAAGQQRLGGPTLTCTSWTSCGGRWHGTLCASAARCWARWVLGGWRVGCWPAHSCLPCHTVPGGCRQPVQDASQQCFRGRFHHATVC